MKTRNKPKIGILTAFLLGLTILSSLLFSSLIFNNKRTVKATTVEDTTYISEMFIATPFFLRRGANDTNYYALDLNSGTAYTTGYTGVGFQWRIVDDIQYETRKLQFRLISSNSNAFREWVNIQNDNTEPQDRYNISHAGGNTQPYQYSLNITPHWTYSYIVDIPPGADEYTKVLTDTYMVRAPVNIYFYEDFDDLTSEPYVLETEYHLAKKSSEITWSTFFTGTWNSFYNQGLITSITFKTLNNLTLCRIEYVNTVDVNGFNQNYTLEELQAMSYKTYFTNANEDFYTMGYNDGYRKGTAEGLAGNDSFKGAGAIFQAVFDLLDVKIFGYVSIGTLLLIPLVLGIVYFILKFTRG